MDNISHGVDNVLNVVRTIKPMLGAGLGGFGQLISVAVGALIGFFGVYVTIRHDAKERKKEREHDIKKSVYLEVCEAIAKAQENIVRISNAHVLKPGFNSSVEGLYSPINKFLSVGSEDTIKSIANFLSIYQDSLMDILLRRLPFSSLQIEIDSIDGLADNFAKMRDGYYLRASKIFDDPSGDHKYALFVNQQGLDTANKISELAKEKVNKTELQFKVVASNASEILKFINDVNKAATLIFLSMRKELGVPTNDEDFIEIINGAIEESKIKLDKFIAGLEKHVKEDPKSTEEKPVSSGG